jgi:hypothetical protein
MEVAQLTVKISFVKQEGGYTDVDRWDQLQEETAVGSLFTAPQREFLQALVARHHIRLPVVITIDGHYVIVGTEPHGISLSISMVLHSGRAIKIHSFYDQMDERSFDSVGIATLEEKLQELEFPSIEKLDSCFKWCRPGSPADFEISCQDG